MIRVLTVCFVVLVLVVYCSTQEAEMPDQANKTTTSSPTGAGFMMLPSILSCILPAGLLTFLLHELHC